MRLPSLLGATALLLGLLALAAAPAEAGPLPAGMERAAAVWVGNDAYLFGGDGAGGPRDQIVRFSAATGTALVVGNLPSPASAPSAVYDGTAVYLFGGFDGARSDKIVRYVPGGAATVLSAKLPTPRDATSAVWDGTHAYIFGGDAAAGPLSDVVRFDPATGAVDLLGPLLPSGRAATSAVWDGAHAYVFGGATGAARLDEVVRFTPASNSAALVARLPDQVSWSAAAWNGDTAYVLGGQLGSTGKSSTAVFSYTPCSGVVAVASPLEGPDRQRAAAAPNGGGLAFVFGGRKDPGTLLDDARPYQMPAHACGSAPPPVDDGEQAPPADDEPTQPQPQPSQPANRTQGNPPASADADGDGVQDNADNCPDLKNRDQADWDRDGLGDACDPDAAPSDESSRSTDAAQPAFADADADGVPDAHDGCPTLATPDQRDFDQDGMGDACDLDVDGDGVAEGIAARHGDNCPAVANPTQADLDGDGIGDACDLPPPQPAFAGPLRKGAAPAATGKANGAAIALGVFSGLAAAAAASLVCILVVARKRARAA